MSLAQGAPAGTPWLSIPRPFDPENAISDDDALLRFQQSSASISKTNPMANKTVAVLKAECKTLGLRRTGSKPMLIDRLEQAHRRLERGIPIIDNEVQKTGSIDWYMLQTANGFEGSVARTMRQAIAGPLKGDVEKVFIPLLEGETTVRDNSVMPSYIFVRMRMNKNLYQVVSNMNYVINFVGADYGGRSLNGQMRGSRGFVKPMPLTDEAFENIITLTKQKRGDDGKLLGAFAGAGAAGAAAAVATFEADDMVQVTEGPFKGLQGPVLAAATDADADADADGGAEAEAEAEAEMVRVALSIMGRETAVKLPARHLVRLTAEDVGGRSVADDEAEVAEEQPEDDYGFFAEQEGGEGADSS